MKRAEPLANS